MTGSRVVSMMAAISIAVPAASWAVPKPVTIGSGKLSGTVDAGIESWKGIPFAKPPEGALRWRAPQPVAGWKGTLRATTYQHDCMQLPFPSDAAPLGTSPSEDCLYVNVWRPSDVPKTIKLPVVFWIYGGGFVNGGSSPPTYSGANLARQGVVVVSFNYRLGRFGVFAHPALVEEHRDGQFTGNFGFLDQIAALKWVHRNIPAFGGDARNVTLVGESAGGRSVHVLLTSPATNGLFARAVIMSGGDGRSLTGQSLQSAERMDAAFGSANGIDPNDSSAAAKLRALAPDKVIAGLNLATLAGITKAQIFSGPYLDGFVSVDARNAYRLGHFKRVPVMIGATSADIGGDSGPMIVGARELATTIAKWAVPVYEYRFSYVADSIGKIGATHASDIPFFFDTTAIKYGAATTAKDVAMGKIISRYLANFAKTGNPNGPGLPAWPAYAPTKDELMNFGSDGKAGAEKDSVAARR